MRKKIKGVSINKKVIFLSLIISMSIIGASYASWNNDNKIKLSMETGFIDPVFMLQNDTLRYDGEYLKVSVSDDRQTLNVSGEVYSGFNENIVINIKDNGSIPSVLNEVYEDEGTVSSLNNYSNGNEYMESFLLNIRADDESAQFHEIEYSDEVLNLEQNKEFVEFVEKEIKSYEEEKNYEFSYILTFGYGKWYKELYIKGNVKVVPNPEVLSAMNSSLNELQIQSDEQIAYEEQQRLLLEQQKLLEEQMLSEQNNSEQMPETGDNQEIEGNIEKKEETEETEETEEEESLKTEYDNNLPEKTSDINNREESAEPEASINDLSETNDNSVYIHELTE